MKQKLIKYLLAVITIAAIVVPASFAVITVDVNKVQAIYDYSDFSKTGGASKIYNPVDDKYTFVYKNATVTGYYGTDRKFITEQIVTKDAAGVTRKVEDLINQRVMEYDDAGKLVKAYSYYDGQKYEAKITYNSDGSYTVSWAGKIDKDGDPNTTNDQEVIQDATVQKYDPAGRLIEVVNKSWDKDKQQYTTATSKNIYDGAGNLIRVDTYSSEGKLLSQTYFDSLGRESHTMSYDPKGNYWYMSSKNFYDGLKLVKTENYEQTGPGTQKLQSTVHYDNHGRISYVTDAMGREIQRYFYNDTNQTKTETVKYGDKEVTVTAKPGQIVKVENYSYGDNGIKTTMMTYFDQNKQKITIMGESTVWNVDKYNAWLKQIAPDIPYAYDPTAKGQLKLVDKGNSEVYVALEIKDENTYKNLINEVDKAIKDTKNENMKNKFQEIKSKLQEQWNKDKKITLCVGAINEPTNQELDQSGSGDLGGGLRMDTLDTQSMWDSAAMLDLINKAKNNETATLTWGYWAVDSKGNVWIFV